jgi:hypothetical protein
VSLAASDEEILSELSSGRLRRFADWPDHELAKGPPGIYTIWVDGAFVYVGIAYKDAKDTTNPQAAGVRGRLGVHARARRSSDLMVGLGDRFVIPHLSSRELWSLGDGRLDLAERMREWFTAHVGYRAAISGSDQARALEDLIRSVGLPGIGTPLLNAK